jgi:hypothetical protein
MEKYKTDISIFAGLLVLVFSIWMVTLGSSTIDLQLYDTYIVIDKISMTFLIIGPLTFLIFLVRGLRKRFGTIAPNVGLIFGIILVSLITYRIIQFQENYLSEMVRQIDGGTPDRQEFIRNANRQMIWTWALLFFWACGFVVLVIHTIKILRQQVRNPEN